MLGFVEIVSFSSLSNEGDEQYTIEDYLVRVGLVIRSTDSLKEAVIESF